MVVEVASKALTTVLIMASAWNCINNDLFNHSLHFDDRLYCYLLNINWFDINFGSSFSSFLSSSFSFFLDLAKAIGSWYVPALSWLSTTPLQKCHQLINSRHQNSCKLFNGHNYQVTWGIPISLGRLNESPAISRVIA